MAQIRENLRHNWGFRLLTGIGAAGFEPTTPTTPRCLVTPVIHWYDCKVKG